MSIQEPEVGFQSVLSRRTETLAFRRWQTQEDRPDTGIVTVLANAVNPAGRRWGEHDQLTGETTDLMDRLGKWSELTPIARDPNDTVSRYWPRILPGGKAILFTGIAGWQGDNEGMSGWSLLCF